MNDYIRGTVGGGIEGNAAIGKDHDQQTQAVTLNFPGETPVNRYALKHNLTIEERLARLELQINGDEGIPVPGILHRISAMERQINRIYWVNMSQLLVLLLIALLLWSRGW